MTAVPFPAPTWHHWFRMGSRTITPARARFRALLLLTLLGVLGSFLIWWMAFYHMQDNLLFPTHLTHKPNAKVIYTQAEILRTPIAEGGVVEALLINQPDAAKTGQRLPVVVYFHSNVDTVDELAGVITPYFTMGFAVLLPEYRGYGRSRGVPSEEAIHQDMLAFHQQLTAREDIDADRIIFHGRAVGGAIAAKLAQVHPPRAMILESTYKSFAAMAYEFAAPQSLVSNPYRTDSVVAQFERPLLIFHGSEDDLIPVAHGRALRDAASPMFTRYIEYDCGHGDFPGMPNRGDYWKQIRAFLGSLGLKPVI